MSIEFVRHLSCSKTICIYSQGIFFCKCVFVFEIEYIFVLWLPCWRDLSSEFERHLCCNRAICISSQGASQALRPEVEEVQVLGREKFWTVEESED